MNDRNRTGDKDETHLFIWFLQIDTHIYNKHISCMYWFIYTYNCCICTWLEDNEEDFVEDPNHISEDDDFVSTDDKEEDEEWTNFAILCYFDYKLVYLALYNDEFGWFIN